MMHVCTWLEKRAMTRLGAIKLGVDSWGRQEHHAGAYSWSLAEGRYKPAGTFQKMISFKSRATTDEGHRVEYFVRSVNGVSCIDIMFISVNGLSITNHTLIHIDDITKLFSLKKPFVHQCQLVTNSPIPDWVAAKKWVDGVAELEGVSTRKVSGGKNKRKDS